MNRRIENPLFFMKGRLVYYTVLGAVLFVGGGLLFINDLADAAGRDRISFASNRTGNFDIYVMDTNGENLRNLTNHPTDEFGPWAPAGLPVHTWSPDGRFLAYVSGRDGSFKIYVMDTRTWKHRRLTHRREWEWDPAWSPDGKQIAFSLYIPNAEREHLCVIDVDGKNLRQLTQGGPIAGPRAGEKQKPVKEPAFLLPPPIPLPEIGSPTWSPDGKQIAYVYSDTVLWQTADIYIIDAEGNGRGTPLVEGARQDLSPAWVPEGFLSVSPQPQLLTTLWAEVKKQQK